MLIHENMYGYSKLLDNRRDLINDVMSKLALITNRLEWNKRLDGNVSNTLKRRDGKSNDALCLG